METRAGTRNNANEASTALVALVRLLAREAAREAFAPSSDPSGIQRHRSTTDKHGDKQ